MEYSTITTGLVPLTEMEISLVEINIEYLITKFPEYLF